MAEDQPKPDEAQAAPAADATPEQPAAEAAPSEAASVDAPSELDAPIPEGENAITAKPPEEDPKKKKRGGGVLKKFNIYILLFVFILVIAGGVGIVSFLGSSKTPKQANIATQQLTQQALSKLASSDANIGNAAQTLTVQGNAIFTGQVLVRSSLNVAGGIQLGGTLQVPSLTVDGQSTLSNTQISTLQVAGTTSLQGTTNLKDINVAGAAAFSGPITASQITVTKLIISGNGAIVVPNHLSFPGATPGRSVNTSTLGSGGSASINGSDTSGTININTGGGPAAGCFISMTFSQPFTNSPHVIISPVGAPTGSLDYYVNRSTSGFSVCTNNTPSSGTVYTFDYFITD